MNDPDNFMRSYKHYRQNQAKANQRNKKAVFDALAAAGISEVHADFDGEGDSGQINSVFALRAGERVTLPNAIVAIREVSWGSSSRASVSKMPLEQAIETLCFGFLEETHGGWENNDGAYGEFRFDVAKRSIALEFNGRFTDVSTENHTF